MAPWLRTPQASEVWALIEQVLENRGVPNREPGSVRAAHPPPPPSGAPNDLISSDLLRATYSESMRLPPHTEFLPFAGPFTGPRFPRGVPAHLQGALPALKSNCHARGPRTRDAGTTQILL